MSQYATLYAHAKRLRVNAVMTKEMADTLRKIFPHVSIPTGRVVKPKGCSWDWNYIDFTNLTKAAFGPNGTGNVFISGFPADVPTFNAYRDDLSLAGEFSFDLVVKMGARTFMRKVARKAKANVFVGVHVRRTDYSVYLKNKVNGRMLTKMYFNSSMDYFRKKYSGANSKVVFVMSSDDISWCKKMFGDRKDVVFTQMSHLMNRAEFDLAILAQCNHTILRCASFLVTFDNNFL